MGNDTGLDGRDDPGLDGWVRPRPRPDDHAELLSALDTHDLAVATDSASPDVVAYRFPGAGANART